ncbi:MAG: hypothetical protein DRP29_02770 [Thermodesulfobacteriota bacterium]|nr:MAG: hypothetical protein DRP29_02770 [Thermodesulfobacteriota bacterium]
MIKFYTLEWIFDVLNEYQKGSGPYLLEDKEVNFSPKIFLLALLHLYQKKRFTPKELAEMLAIEEKDVEDKRSEFDFMYLVDILRREFSFWFRELIISRDFSDEVYEKLAKEFLFLEEQLRKQIQIPLLDQMKKIVRDLESKLESGKNLDVYDENRFFRLLKFFNKVENLKASLCSRLVNRAKDVAEKAYKDKILLTSIKVSDFPDGFKLKLREEIENRIKECFLTSGD